ncbi:MAG TPA: hypothetical protein VGY54_19000, partial [Polyangiaceae bacterium]|nr:hypothetical protein [Polyangiaceae bacterium]
RLDSVIPELIKRAVEIGVEKASEAPDNLKDFALGMKLPRDMANSLLAQVDETKSGLFRVVAKEVREFLQHANMAGELHKLLTTVQFEISTTIRFRPNDADAGADGDDPKLPKPEVKADVQMKRARNFERSESAPSSGGAGGAMAAEDRPRERRRGRE